MKKKIVLLMLCLMGMGQAWAADVLTVAPVSVPQGSEATVAVCCEFENSYKAFQFDIELPEGVSVVTDGQGRALCEKGFDNTDHTISAGTFSNGSCTFVCTSMNNELLPKSGILLKVKVTTAANVGDVFECTVKNTEFTAVDYDVVNLADVKFTVSVTEAPDTHTVLDENATIAPEPSDGVVNVRVKRNLRGGVWNTLVLPFDMTAEQVRTAFGDEARLATFEGAESDTDAEGNVVVISVNFAYASAIAANAPCLLWTNVDLAEWMVDGVTIAPAEEPSVERDERVVKVGKNTFTSYNRFVGTYVAGTTIPEMCLFLSGNKFYYTDGVTTIKAFRAYFDFYDVLAEAEGGNAVKLNVYVDGSETGIGELEPVRATGAGSLYNLAGQRISRMQRGVNIVNGKKFLK